MVGTTTRGGGACGDAPPPPPPPQEQLLSSVRASFPCDSEEFSDLFNQLLSPEMDHPNNNNNIITTTTKNRVHPFFSSSSSSVSNSSVFNFSSHHHHNDPFDQNNNHHNNSNNDDYIPATPFPHPISNANNTDTNTKQHPINSPIQNDEDSELPSKPVPPPRTSSKRSRAAEFHNLSEKRRRSRINEKMKALQNLIPNSNKTDKASMLDEAIEYLKQLQLQVQMLMMRNGLSLHPMSLPGGLRPMVLPHTGLNLEEGDEFQNSVGGIVSSANDENLARPPFGFPKPCSISDQSAAMPSLTSIATSDTSSSFQPSIKDAQCSSMPQLILDKRRIGKSPSPDVS